MKTPEEMARERYHTDRVGDEAIDVNLQRQAYITGYQAAQPQWISVKDRLPEEDAAVLVYGQVLNDPPDIIGVRRMYKGDQEWKRTWESEDGFIYDEDDVTHWMPLLPPPKDEA
jgi:hypothetical protein